MANIIQEQPSMGLVRLGDFEQIPVVSQKHARLRRHLSYDDFQKIMSKKYSEHSYRLLCILIPAIDPKNPKAVKPIQEWEFDGFSSEERWKSYKAGDPNAYDEDGDPGPTPDEIAVAFEVALRVNGAGRLGKIVSLVQSATKVIEIEQANSETALLSTQPGNSGESDSNSSGTTVPTQS